MVDAMKVKKAIYFATLQGHVFFETELYHIIFNSPCYQLFIILLCDVLSEPEFYGDLIYQCMKLTYRNDSSPQFRKVIRSMRYKRIQL